MATCTTILGAVLLSLLCPEVSNVVSRESDMPITQPALVPIPPTLGEACICMLGWHQACLDGKPNNPKSIEAWSERQKSTRLEL